MYEVLAEYAASFTFNLTEATRWSRDKLQKRSRPVGRQAIGFVVRGSMYGGAPLNGNPSPTAAEIQEAFVANVLGRAAAADIDLDDTESQQLREWFSGETP